MGMSGDYAAAIKEGSTMMRIGTAIFRAQDYQNNKSAPDCWRTTRSTSWIFPADTCILNQTHP